MYEWNEICLNGRTSEWNMEQVEKRKEKIRSKGMVPYFFWECEVDRLAEKDKFMRDCMDSYPAVGPLLPRDAFQGLVNLTHHLFHSSYIVDVSVLSV